MLNYSNKQTIEEIELDINKKRLLTDDINIGCEQGLFISNDNYLAMVSLLNSFESKIDLVYIDPPYNTNNSFYCGAERTSTISSSKNDRLAYNDSMKFDEYLEFLRVRFILIKKLLSNKGTLYVHIDCKVGHYLKIILDEVFGIDNFVNDISRVKSNPKNFNRNAFGNKKDMILIYSKYPKKNIFNDIRVPLTRDKIASKFNKIDKKGRRYTTVPCHAPGETISGETGGAWKGINPPVGRHWRVAPSKLDELDKKGLIEWSKNKNPRIIKYADEHIGEKMQDVWIDYKDPTRPIYPTQKNISMLEMIIEQSSNKGSIIMDCFCGSSSFLIAGVLKNRYVIGIDNSPIAKEIFIKNYKNLHNIKIIE